MRPRRIDIGPGLALAGLEWDGTASPEFVLVHGLASNARMWAGVAERLAGAGHRVVALDLRGHGESDQPADGYSVGEVAGDVAVVIETLGLDRPVVAGQSWGGNVVLELAAQRPDLLRGAAAVDGGDIELAARFNDWESCAAALAPPDLGDLTIARLEAMLRDRHPDWPGTGIAGFLANFRTDASGRVAARLPRDLHMKVLRGLWEHRPSERYAPVSCPVLFVGADDGSERMPDKRAQMEKVAAMLADADLMWIPGDHDLHAQQPEVVAGALLERFDGD